MPSLLSRRGFFLRSAVLTAGAVAGAGGLRRADALLRIGGPEDPEPSNEEVARILRELSAGRPIRRGHVSLDMPAVAEDGRVVPVMIESDLPMTPESYVKGVHLIVDHNPDAHLAAFHLTPVIGSCAITTRIKMKRTTWVRAIIETSGGELWADYTKVLVTLNGCG
jgi:sulfur-oxidizing protein SoxY